MQLLFPQLILKEVNMKIGSYVQVNTHPTLPKGIYKIIELDDYANYVKLDNYDNKWYSINDFIEASPEAIFNATLVEKLATWQEELSKNSKYKNIAKEMKEFLAESVRYI